MRTTAAEYSEFGQQEQYERIYSYIGGGDLTEDEQNALAKALFDELSGEIARRLPDVHWQPDTCQ